MGGKCARRICVIFSSNFQHILSRVFCSDQLLENPKIVNANSRLKEWHTEKYEERLPGLKFNRTVCVCAVSGRPYEYTAKSLHDAHFELQIPPEVFDEVSAELGRALDYFKVPEREKMKPWPRLTHKSLM